MPGEAEWLDVDYRTLFRLRADGRIEGENDPDRSPGPRFWLASCAEAIVFGVRSDVPDDVAAELTTLARAEPPFVHPATPRSLDRYVSMLRAPGAVPKYNLGLIYDLQHARPALPSDARGTQLIVSDTEDGHALLRSLSRSGMPEGMLELGFRTPADFWPPWCAAIVDGEIAAVAFAARLSDLGAELGVATAKAFSGRGLAAAATARWSRHVPLQSRTLFYSADRDNQSSQRVAARLALSLRGASLRIA